MSNTEKFRQALKKVTEKFEAMSPEEVRELVDNTPDKWGSLLLKGGFIRTQEEELKSEIKNIFTRLGGCNED